jgi:opacity protein-like surface antigen
MLNKSLLVGAIALAASSVALADGFYVGAGVGGTGFHNQSNIDNGVVKSDTGNLGVIGGVLAGYNWNFANQFNLGVEGFANATSAKTTANYLDSTVTVTQKARYNYGVRLVPGYQVTPDTDVHAIVGYVRGNFKTEASAGSFSASKTFNANGFQLGVGSGTNVAKNVVVRGDVVYSGYQSKTVSDAEGDTAKNKINTLDGIVSVAYKFG